MEMYPTTVDPWQRVLEVAASGGTLIGEAHQRVSKLAHSKPFTSQNTLVMDTAHGARFGARAIRKVMLPIDALVGRGDGWHYEARGTIRKGLVGSTVTLLGAAISDLAGGIGYLGAATVACTTEDAAPGCLTPREWNSLVSGTGCLIAGGAVCLILCVPVGLSGSILRSITLATKCGAVGVGGAVGFVAGTAHTVARTASRTRSRSASTPRTTCHGSP